MSSAVTETAPAPRLVVDNTVCTATIRSRGEDVRCTKAFRHDDPLHEGIARDGRLIIAIHDGRGSR